MKILIIQTAFIGDVVLATALVEKLHHALPGASIDFLVRKGNESLLDNNPGINEVLAWDKKRGKTKNLFAIIKIIRGKKYDQVINIQRFFSTGLITMLSGAKEMVGFDKNPLSSFFTRKVKHVFDLENSLHEVERNDGLIRHLTDTVIKRPVLYPSAEDLEKVSGYTVNPFITITPSSVWFTKKFPLDKWIKAINEFEPSYRIYLLGGKDNYDECQYISINAKHKNLVTLAGKLSFLQSAALMKFAAMNYVNDSAPLHFASAMNAPVTAIFCSTIPAFGYTPLSDRSYIVQTKEALTCRPCGIHGRKACPLKHFRCAYGIETEQVLQTLDYAD